MTDQPAQDASPVAAEPQTGDKDGVDPEALEPLELRRARQVLAETHRHPDLAPPCRCDRPLMLTDEAEPAACARCGRTPR